MRTGLGQVSRIKQALIWGSPAASAGPRGGGGGCCLSPGLPGLLQEPQLQPTFPRLGLCQSQFVAQTVFGLRPLCLQLKLFLPLNAIPGQLLPAAQHHTGLSPLAPCPAAVPKPWVVSPPPPEQDMWRLACVSSPGWGRADRQRGPAPLWRLPWGSHPGLVSCQAWVPILKTRQASGPYFVYTLMVRLSSDVA